MRNPRPSDPQPALPGEEFAAEPPEVIASSPESATGAALLKRYGPAAKRFPKDVG